MRYLRAHAPALALVAVVFGSALARLWVNRAFQGPQILCDKYIYAGVPGALRRPGTWASAGGRPWAETLLYPALIAPAWLAHTMATVFGLVKAVNATLVSLTAVPVYLWTRASCRRGGAWSPRSSSC